MIFVSSNLLVSGLIFLATCTRRTVHGLCAWPGLSYYRIEAAATESVDINAEPNQRCCKRTRTRIQHVIPAAADDSKAIYAPLQLARTATAEEPDHIWTAYIIYGYGRGNGINGKQRRVTSLRSTPSAGAINLATSSTNARLPRISAAVSSAANTTRSRAYRLAYLCERRTECRDQEGERYGVRCGGGVIA